MHLRLTVFKTIDNSHRTRNVIAILTHTKEEVIHMYVKILQYLSDEYKVVKKNNKIHVYIRYKIMNNTYVPVFKINISPVYMHRYKLFLKYL